MQSPLLKLALYKPGRLHLIHDWHDAQLAQSHTDLGCYQGVVYFRFVSFPALSKTCRQFNIWIGDSKLLLGVNVWVCV